MGRIVLFLIGLLLMASGVMAAIIQVGPGQTYTTIQAAVNAASAGDEIQVAAGTYTEAITIPIGKALTITGANAGVAAGNNPGVRGAETIIDGGIRLLSASTINGISIQNGIQLGSFKYGVSVEADGATVINCIVTNVPNEGGIVTLTNIDNFTLTNSTIQNNYRGIYFNPGGGHSLTGNLIDANNGAGVGIGSDGLSNFTMTGNTISNHTMEGWGASGVGTNVVAEGNSFLNNGVSVAHYGGNTIDASPNYWNGSPSTSGTVTNDPWWADASMTILASNSPVKNVTQSLFYGTIQAAIDAATSGDVISVSNGTYNERLVITKSLTLQGANEATTIIDGSTFTSAGRGILINNGVTNVTIQNLTVQNFIGSDGNTHGGIYAIGGNNYLTIQNVTIKDNRGTSTSGSGFYANGPIDNVVLDHVTSSGHYPGARGIVIWNGLKSNITITNCEVFNNNCCGIELQDGTASGVTMENNLIYNNADNGIGVVGLQGPGENLIKGNTLTNNGRFGIEVKNPDGSGLATGAGRIVVENNTVTRNTAITDLRDLAGIAVMRRGVLAGNVDIPKGVVVQNNTVSGYTQTSTSDGFGIVIGGMNHTVSGNTLSGNDVGLQQQAGHLPYPADGDQNNLSDQYFGRDNSPFACGNALTGNIYSGNTADYREVGGPFGSGKITNLITGTEYCSIQAAIDGATAGDVIEIDGMDITVSASINVNKSITLQPKTAGNTTITGTSASAVPVFIIQANNVIIQGLNITLSQAGLDAYTGYDGLIQVPQITGGYTGIQILSNTIWTPLQGARNTMSTWKAFGVKIDRYSSATISGNTIFNTRQGISGGYGTSLIIQNNNIYNTKGGVCIYTNQGDIASHTISGNTWNAPVATPELSHSEWDITWHSGGTYTSTDWSAHYATYVYALSLANDNGYVVDRRGEGIVQALGGNRSHVFVDASSSIIVYGSGTGSFNDPLATIALGIQSVVTQGKILVAAGNYAENVVIDRGLTMHGANTGIACGSRGTESTISPLSGLPVTISGNGVTMNGFEITAPGYQYAINCGNTSNTSILFNNIHDVGTTLATNTNVHSVIYTVANGASTTNLSITDNCFSDISSSNLTGFSASAIGILQSTSTGVLTGLDIERNIINGVTVNTGTWPTGKIAYGIQINTGGGSGYLATTGEVVNATLANNEISNIIGFIATGIGLEGNTLNAQVKNNRIANLTGHKAADRNGGGYDLQGLKFENNRYLATCLVEDNKFETNTYTNGTTIPLGYAVANYVPVGGTYTGGTTGAATLGCNWYGTSVDSEIADNANLDGKIFNKDNCQTNYLPYLTNGTDADPATLGFQPQPNTCSGGSAVANATQGEAYTTIQDAVDAAVNGDLIVVTLGGTYAGVVFDESGKSITLQNTSGATVTIQGASPALTVTSGTLTVDGITYTTATDDPTILVNGGSLTMTNCSITESTAFNQTGVMVTAGTVNLGTLGTPGHNTFITDGTGKAVTNNSTTAVDAIGNYWGTVDPTAVAALISGTTNYSPWCNEDFSICGYTAGSPVTTIGIPTEVSCGVYDFPVTVQNFNNIGAISLTLNYDPAVLSYTSVTLNTAITGAPVSNPLPGTFILGYFESTGGSISLADNAVLFTLRFTLLPAASGAASVLSWNTSDPAYCEYGGVGPNFDPYVSAFINLSTWNIPVRPVKNVNTSLEYCKIQEAIDATETVNGHVIEVSSGTYDEQVLVNKGLTIKGVGLTKPIIDYTGTVSGKPTLFDIPVDNVTIENLNFKVDLSKLRSAIIASGSGIDNITVKSNLIEPYGTAAGSYGDRNAVSINYGGTTNYRTASGGVDNILYQDNTVALGASSGFRAAIAIDEGNASITGNIATTINHDVLVRFSSGAVTVTGNTCYGGGMEFSDFNLGTGTLTISNNTFDGTIGNTYTNALRLKNNYTARTTIVSNNTFTHFVGNIAGYGGTVSLENYQAITLDGNTFTPLANSTTFRHITINTKDFSSSSGHYTPVVGATLTNNIFNGSGTPGGVALSFYNWDNDSPTFNAFELGTTGNENTFNAGIGTFILLDNSDGTVLPNNTTMVPWAIDLDATNNKFDVGAGLELPAAMSLENLFALEDKIQHAIDDGDLGFVKVKDLNTYVTPGSFIAPATTTPSIQRGIDAASNGWTVNVNDGIYVENVNVNKQVTVDGYSQSGVIVYPALSGPNPCSGASLCPGASNIFLVQANNVTIKDLTADGNNTSLTSGVLSNGVDVDARNGIITDHTTGSFTNLNVQNVTVQNIYLRGIYFSATGGSYNFSNNSVSNVAGESNSIGIMGWASTGTISGNTVTNSNDGISLNHSIGTTIANNTVTGCGSGIHTDNNGSGGTGTADIISNNTVSNCGYGIFAFAPYFNVSVDGNTVTNCDVGLTSAGTYSTAAPTFTNNVVDGTGKVNSYGVYSTTEIWGWVSGNQYASFSNNYIQNTSNAFLLCSQSGFTNNTSANNNSITGNTLGVKLAADNTEIPPTGNFGLSMTCNWWGSNTVAGVVTAVGSTDPAVTYDPWLVDGTDNDLVAIGFQPIPNSCTGAANLYVNDLVSDNGTNDTYTTAIGDDANAGTAAAPFLTITKAVNTAVDGTKIWVDAGTFQEQVSINKTLDVTGVSRDLTNVKAPATLSTLPWHSGNSNPIVYASGNANTVNISKLAIDGDGGRSIDNYVGMLYYEANGTFDLCKVSGIHDATSFTGAQRGHAYYGSHAGTMTQTLNITNNIIEDYQKGGIYVRGDGTSATITGNTVTGQNTPLVNGQNGIVVMMGAVGNVQSNTVSNNIWNKVEHPHVAVASGIMLYQSGASEVSNNTLSGNECALITSGYATGTIFGANTFSNNKIHLWLDAVSDINAANVYDKYVLDPPNNPEVVFGCIQYAIDEATAGDVLNASAGTFIENVNVHTSVSLNGAASLASIIDGGGAGTVVTIAANNTTLNGFKVQNSGATATDAGVKLTDGGMTGVTGCTITNNEITTFNGLGIIGGSANSLTLNNIHNNAAYGALLIGTSGNTIESNTISNTGLDGIALDNASAVGGPLSIGSTGNFIKSNTISNGGRDGIFIGENCSGNYITDGNVLNTIASIGINVWRPSGQTITDNSITNALTGIRLLGSSNNTITGNTLTTNGTGIIIDPSWQSDVWYSSDNNTITGNTIASNTVGMDADDVNQNPVTAEINWWGDASGPYHATLNPCGLGNAVTDNVDFSPWYFQSGMTTLNGLSPVAVTTTENVSTVTATPVVFNTTVAYGSDITNYDPAILADARITSNPAFPAGAQVIGVKYNGTDVLPAAYSLTGTQAYLSDILAGSPYPLNQHNNVTDVWEVIVAGFNSDQTYAISMDAVSYTGAETNCNTVRGSDAFNVTFAPVDFTYTPETPVCELNPVNVPYTETYPLVENNGGNRVLNDSKWEFYTDAGMTTPFALPIGTKITVGQVNGLGAFTWSSTSTLTTAVSSLYGSAVVTGQGNPSTYDYGQLVALTRPAVTNDWMAILEGVPAGTYYVKVKNLAMLDPDGLQYVPTWPHGTFTEFVYDEQSFQVVVNDCGISGVLTYYNNAASLLKNVPISLYQNGSPVLDGSNNPVVATTDGTTAAYTFPGLPAGTYELRPAKTDEVRSINATDAAQVNYWNVNNSPIEKVRYLAGDVNRASTPLYITAFDAQQILLYFVSAGTHVWTGAPSWSFYNAGQTISANPWAENIYPKVTITNTPMTNQNIYGMVTGDFNRSWTPSSKGASQSLSLNDGQMVQVAPNTEILLPITAANAMEVGAVSLILTYPDDKVSIEGVYVGNNPTQPMLYNANNGVVRIGWTSPMPMELLTGNTLITLKLRTASNLGSNETIRFELTADPLNELANGQSQVISPASLIADILVTSTTGLTDMQGSNLQLTCYPNPFTETTTIHYYLPVKGFVTLDLFDLVGQKVTSLVAQHADAGSHSLCLQSTSISSGVYLARITFRYEGQTFTRTIKLVRQD